MAAGGARRACDRFEQFTPGHDKGSSHGESRIIRTAYAEGADYVPLIRQAFPLWRQLEEESGAALLTMTGSLMIGRPASELVSGAIASLRAHGLAHEVLDAAEMGRRYPQHRLAADEVGVYEKMAGFLRPEAAVMCAAGCAERLGATIHRQTVVDELDLTVDGVRIRAADTTYRARHVIVAAGPWLGTLLPQLRLPLRVERQVLAWFAVRDRALYDQARCPVYIHETEPGHHRYGFPTLDGTTVKVAVHHEGATATTRDIDRAVHRQDLAPVEGYARKHLAALKPIAVRGQVCLYTNTPDLHFVIGSPRAMPAVTVMSCCSGHGFKFASVLGDIAADLALNGRTAYPIDRFSPLRFY